MTMKLLQNTLLMISLSSSAFLAVADNDKFTYGPVFESYGKHAAVKQEHKLNKNTKFKVAFDISKQATAGQVNRGIESLARFINMHVANGIDAKNIQLALVVHGKAGFDLLHNVAHNKKFQQENANKVLLSFLMEHQVDIYLCGQSATYMGIDNDMLLPGVNMALSAMTAHAVLQNSGYSLNPF
jgi:intracellular sulfur oxidation DsrE/DsrF family protein